MRFHEGGSWGGHTISEHIGKSFGDLRSRLAANPNMKRASSFFDQATAESTISRVFSQNRSAISAWSRNAQTGSRKAFDLSENSDVLGRGVLQQSGRYLELNNLTGASVVLKSTGNGNFQILTAFPK